MAGLYFEEFTEGQVFEHALTRTVTDMDNVLFTTLTMNPQPLHLDAEFARTTEFGKPLVNSIFTLGLVIGISVGDTTLGTTVANLGMTDVRFPKPRGTGRRRAGSPANFSKRTGRTGSCATSGSIRWRAGSRSTISPPLSGAARTAFCCPNACRRRSARPTITFRLSRQRRRRR